MAVKYYTLLQQEEYLSEQIHYCYCKEWAYFTLSATEGKVNGYDVSFTWCVKRGVLCTVKIYRAEDKTWAIPSTLVTADCKLGN